MCSAVRRSRRATRKGSALRRTGGPILRSQQDPGRRSSELIMSTYIVRRLLLMIPTLLGILFVSFIVVQFAPGGPVERVIAQLTGADTGASSRISGSSGGDMGSRLPGNVAGSTVNSKYRGA